MKEVILKIHCSACNKFKTKIVVYQNEHGYFEIPNGFCPKCFSPLIQVVNGADKQNAN